MPRAAPGRNLEPPLRRLRWPAAHRILPSRYPPIQLFERLTDEPAEWKTLAEIESLTNPRIRDQIGGIRLVPPEKRVSGPGASWVMASLTHLNPSGSRFSDGSYGVYYAARELATAITETVFHLGRFYAATADPPHAEDMRVLAGRIDARFHDLRGDPQWRLCLDPDGYAASRKLGRGLRAQGSNGVVYPSVRRRGGQCLGAFRPKAVGIPVQGPHLQYYWDGQRISRYFEYAKERWVELAAEAAGSDPTTGHLREVNAAGAQLGSIGWCSAGPVHGAGRKSKELDMETDWKSANHHLSQAINTYRHAAPGVAGAFSGLAQAATKPGALDPKTKELIALAIGIAGRCDGCVGFHTQAAIRHGASRDEILDTIGVAVYMGGGPSYVYGAQALQAFDQLSSA